MAPVVPVSIVTGNLICVGFWIDCVHAGKYYISVGIIRNLSDVIFSTPSQTQIWGGGLKNF